MDKKKFQLELFKQFIEDKELQDEWEKFKDENLHELAKIFRGQEGIRESYSEFLVDALEIDPSQLEISDFTKSSMLRQR